MTFKNGFWDKNDELAFVTAYSLLKGQEYQKMVDEQKKGINWEEENKQLKEKSENYWKPKQGMNQLVFLDNGEFTKGKDFQGKEVDKVRFLVSVDKQQYWWDVNKAQTRNSLYGQITQLASRKGSLAGMMALLNVAGQKKDTRYALIDPTQIPAAEVKG